MILYISHSRHGFDFEKELYEPLRNSSLAQEHELILPHASSEYVDAKQIFDTKKDVVVIAEASFPATGQGIEVAWAYDRGIPVALIHRAENKPSSSLLSLSAAHYAYTNQQELIEAIHKGLEETKDFQGTVRKIPSHRAIAGIKAIITHPTEKKFLALKHIIEGQTIWEFPGGGIKQGEDPFDSLVREAKEEAGLNIEVGPFAGMFWFFAIMGGQEVMCVCYVCKPKNDHADISIANKDEPGGNIVEAKWVTKEEFLSNDYPVGHPSIKEVIKNLNW